MHLTISPVRGLPGQPETRLRVQGDILTADGEDYDLSSVPEGGSAEAEGEDHPFVGPITRQRGVIHATVRVLLGDTAAPAQPCDPAHWVVPEAEGEVDPPALRQVPEGDNDHSEGA